MIKLNDIIKRKNYLKNYNHEYIHENFIKEAKNGNTDHMLKIIKNWTSLEGENVFSIKECMNIYNEYCNNTKNKNDINHVDIYIQREMIPSIKNLKESVDIISESKNEQFVQESKKYLNCDRILNNNDKLNKLFKFDKYVQEKYVNNNTDEIIFELCNCIDHLDEPIDIKYNLALENILYTLSKNGKFNDRKTILEYVTDYFFYKYNDLSALNVMENTLYKTPLYNDIVMENDKTIHDIIEKKKENNPPAIKKAFNTMYGNSPEHVIHELPNYFKLIRRLIIIGTLSINIYFGIIVFIVDKAIELTIKRPQAEKMIKQFKNEKDRAVKLRDKCTNEKTKEKYNKYVKTLDKSIENLEAYEDSLYSEKQNEKRFNASFNLESSYEDIEINKYLDKNIKAYEDIMATDYIMKYHPMMISQMTLTIKKYLELLQTKYRPLAKEEVLISASATHINNFQNVKLNDLPKYLDSDNRICVEIGSCLPLNLLKNPNDTLDREVLKKLKQILCDLCEELDDCSESLYYTEFEGDDELYRILFIFDTPISFESPLQEEFNINIQKDMSYIVSLNENVLNNDNKNNLINMIESNIGKYDYDMIKYVTEFAIECPYIIDNEKLLSIYEDYKRSNSMEYKKQSILAESIFRLRNNNNNLTNINETHYINNIYNDIIDINNIYSSINETSFVNTLKMAKEKLNTNLKKMSDKEKQVSRQIDNSMDKMSSKSRDFLNNTNREAVIKGTIIPSASKVIKLAAGSCLLYHINPALSVIGVLGGIAVSKSLRKKEKQMILDEIDIELKMVEKKIQLADSNNDMKSLEQLLKIEKRLKRERQRIMYNLKVYYTADYGNTSNND